MKLKIVSVVLGVIVIIGLLFGIVNVFNNIVSGRREEIKVAKDFIQNLADNDMIKLDHTNKKIIEEKPLNKLPNIVSSIQYSIIIGNYGVDVDKNYSVIGFSNKNIDENKISLTNTEEIGQENAIDIANKYLTKIIRNEDFKFKEIRVREGEKMPCYNIIFYKLRNGYEFYRQEINVSINKRTGILDGYSNYSLNEINYNDSINIDKEKSNIIINNYLNNLKMKVKKISDPKLLYVSTSNNNMVLGYIYNITSDNDNEKNYDVCVRADSGEVINFNVDSIAKN